MHFEAFVVAWLGATGAVTASHVHGVHKRALKFAPKPVTDAPQTIPRLHKRHVSKYLNNNTQEFAVNGSAIPEVNFDIGESYAGTLSIDGNSSNPNKLWFWFFPSENPAATNEIAIWLNGGPGCSSLDGLLQENGPFQWQPGTYAPQPNPFSWVNLTNMVWVDQPIGTGFSPFGGDAPSNITDEVQVATDFAGFWKNFMTTFNLTGSDVYLAGESYAGQYIPYIADYMLNQSDTDYYNVKGIQINDPSIADDSVLIETPAVTQLNNYANIFALNDTFMTDINKRAEDCRYFDFMETAFTFPPTDKFTAPNSSAPGCEVWEDIVTAAIYVNPCFNIYHLTDYCPFVWNVLGFPQLSGGPNNYFNRSDVQQVLHAPPTNYTICGDNSLGLLSPGDQSLPSSYDPLPRVIEKTNNVIVGNGLLDYLILTNGTLMALNNMTWNGQQGFSNNPLQGDKLFVPYNPSIGFVLEETLDQPIPATPVGLVAGGGYLGTTYTERGLTFTTVTLAGHEIPQYAPGAAYRQFEFLLGRIANLTVQGDFTTQTGNFTGSTPPSPYYNTTQINGTDTTYARYMGRS